MTGLQRVYTHTHTQDAQDNEELGGVRVDTNIDVEYKFSSFPETEMVSPKRACHACCTACRKRIHPDVRTFSSSLNFTIEKLFQYTKK